MRNFFLKAAYFIVVLLSRTIFRPALKAHDAEERKKAMAILEAVDLEIVVDQFVSIATRMLSEDVDDEYIRLCYNWEE